jgi:hypothetical protein
LSRARRAPAGAGTHAVATGPAAVDALQKNALLDYSHHLGEAVRPAHSRRMRGTRSLIREAASISR